MKTRYLVSLFAISAIILVFPLSLVFGLITPKYTDIPPPPGNNIPVDLGVEGFYNWSLSTDQNKIICFTYGGLGNKTITSLQGSISAMDTSPRPSNSWDEVFITYWISPNYLDSNGGTNTSNPCVDGAGNPVYGSTFSALGAQRIGSSIIKMTSQSSVTIPYNLNNINIYIPPGWYLIEQTTATCACSSGNFDIEMQNFAYLKH